ncbi:hypothetical protein [uncultured Oscillibacter sp.]|uniref:hypothetical protein n=1 Tax=uncultured Oscillibacter sp. TaxID=876091 RepID=UPI0025DC0453|nr:hypothetical protein [uncultured Oscillibacter sp.]
MALEQDLKKEENKAPGTQYDCWVPGAAPLHRPGTSLLKMIVSLGVLNKKQIKYQKMATTKIASGTKTKSPPKRRAYAGRIL